MEYLILDLPQFYIAEKGIQASFDAIWLMPASLFAMKEAGSTGPFVKWVE